MIAMRMTTEDWLVIQATILTLTLIVLAWYAYETMRLRRATEEQTRQALMPVLKVRFSGEEIVMENLGPGIAAKVLMQPIRYLDPAGGMVHCTFRPLFMLSPLKPEAVRPEITRQEPVTRLSLEDREAQTVTVLDLDPSRLKDLLLAAGYRRERFVQSVYYSDIVGRTYRLPVTWEHPSIQTRSVGLSHPEPASEAPEPVDVFPGSPEPLEIQGESLIP